MNNPWRGNQYHRSGDVSDTVIVGYMEYLDDMARVTDEQLNQSYAVQLQDATRESVKVLSLQIVDHGSSRSRALVSVDGKMFYVRMYEMEKELRGNDVMRETVVDRVMWCIGEIRETRQENLRLRTFASSLPCVLDDKHSER